MLLNSVDHPGRDAVGLPLSEMPMSDMTTRSTRPSARVGRIALAIGLIVGLTGCGDGVERGAVEVPERTTIQRQPTESAVTSSRHSRRPPPDAKVITLGNMLR
jgi:hypothetical protein